MPDGQRFARNSDFWLNLINAVALELGIAPVVKLPGEPEHSIKDLPEDERRALTRKYRKLRRKHLKHVSKSKARSRLVRSASTLDMTIVDLIEMACARQFENVAAFFDDLKPNAAKRWLAVQKWRRHEYYFNDRDYELLVQAYERAAERLKKGNAT